ncbi:MAG: GH25 family lysozyme [Blautia sp.]|jgi:lysozyme
MKVRGKVRGGNLQRSVCRRLGSVLLALSLIAASVFVPTDTVQAASKFWAKSGSTCYNGAGKVIPRAITRGIDVSMWQGNINWDRVQDADLDFVFLRVGHGTHSLDTKFKNNIKGAVEAQIPVGVYFYSEATTTARSLSDAKWVIKQLQGYKISYPVVVDMEASAQDGLTNTQRSNIAKTFLDEVKKAGYYPMLYCNTDWYLNRLNVSTLAGYDKWMANYGDSLTAPAGVPSSAYTIWQATSGNTDSGLKSTRGLIPGIPKENNVDVDFGYKDYTKVITPRTKAKDSYLAGEQWVKGSGGWKYQLADGSFVTNKWREIDGHWYYFKGDGYRALNWLNLNGKYYYMGSNGMMRTGWQKVGGKYYYLQSDGVMKTGLLKVNGNTYLLAASGERLTGWQKYKTHWLYLGTNGVARRSWQKIGGYTYYFRQNGVMFKGLGKIGGKKYYFDANGRLKTGWFKYTNGKWYYANSKGVIQQNGWIRVKGVWYYLNPTGSMRTGWLSYKGDKYYLLSTTGAMKTGWLKYNGKYYYFASSGKMVRNTTLKIGGKNYTFNANGVRVA